MFVDCMNELIVKYKVATCHYTEQCHVIAYSPINYNIRFTITTCKRVIYIIYKLILNISMVISDMLYILQRFHLNAIDRTGNLA